MVEPTKPALPVPSLWRRLAYAIRIEFHYRSFAKAWECALGARPAGEKGFATVEALVRHRIPASGVDESSVWSAVLNAAETDLEALVAAGAPVNRVSRSPFLDTLLHRAAARGSRGHVRVLLEAGARLEARDGRHYTPLGSALSGHNARQETPWRARRQVVLDLLEAGSDASALQNRDGESPLLVAPFDVEVFQALVRSGASPENLINERDPHCVEGLLFRAPEASSLEDMETFLIWMASLGQGPLKRGCSGNTLAWELVAYGRGEAIRHFPGAVLDLLEKHGFQWKEGREADGKNILHAMLSWRFDGWSEVWLREALENRDLTTLAHRPDDSGDTPAAVLEKILREDESIFLKGYGRGRLSGRQPPPRDLLLAVSARWRRENLEEKIPPLSEDPPVARKRL